MFATLTRANGKIPEQEMKKIFAVMALGLSLTGCASALPSDHNAEPVGIGTGTHEFKKSPCACIEIEMLAPLGYDISDFEKPRV